MFKTTLKDYGVMDLQKGDKWREIIIDDTEGCPDWARVEDKIYEVTRVNSKSYSAEVYLADGEKPVYGCKVSKEARFGIFKDGYGIIHQRIKI